MRKQQAISLRILSGLTVLGLVNLSCNLGETVLGAVADRCADSTFAVTTTLNSRSGSCTAADCTLRNAISLANICPGPQAITVPGGTYSLTVTGVNEDNNQTGDLDITDDVTITGTGHTIYDGNTTDRVFDVHPGARLDLYQGIVQNGVAQAPDEVSLDGGGGVRNQGTLHVSHCRIHNNTSSSYHVAPEFRLPEGSGGGILSTSTLYIDSCAMDGNLASNGGAVAFVATTSSADTVLLADLSSFNDNNAFNGGALYLSAPTRARVTGSLIDNNSSAGGQGGGIYNLGQLDLRQDELGGNGATPWVARSGDRGMSNGGAIWNAGTANLTQVVLQNNQAWAGYALYNSGTASLVKTAVINNQEEYRAPSYDLGALYSTNALYLLNTTVSGNRDGAWSSGNLHVEFSTFADNAGYGLSSASAAEAMIGNSIVATSGGTTCSFGDAGAVTSYGYNIDSNGACGFHSAGDETRNPNILPLTADGSTWVHPLAAGSPAIDSAGGVGPCPGDDQRLASRPGSISECDRGAYEVTTGHALVIATPEPTKAGAGQPGLVQIPTLTPTSGPVTMQLVLVQNANCRRGPGTVFDVLTSVPKGQTVTLSARNEENTWWFTVLPGNNACWLSMVAGQPIGDPNLLVVRASPATPVPTEEPNTCDQYNDEQSCLAAGCGWNANKSLCK